MHFIYDNLAVFVVAVSVSLMGWLFGGTHADILVPVVPWLVLFLLQALFFFPQKHAGESTYDARERVWHALKRDPFVWVVVGFLALLTIPFVNAGMCEYCDRAVIALGFSPDPPVKFLPFCVNRMQHLNIFLIFATALTCAVVIRHALLRRGKRLLVSMVVWNGFALAILGFVQEATGAEGPLWQPFTNVTNGSTFFSTFGYPNMAGDYFTTLFALAVALWRRSCDDVYRRFAQRDGEVTKNAYRTFCLKHYNLIPAGIFFFAALNTLSRAAVILVVSLTVVFFAHTFLAAGRRMKRLERVRKGTVVLASAAILAFFAVESIPEDLQREVDTLSTDAVLTRVTGKGQYHARVATELWREHLLFGCGGWGYKHFCYSIMTPEERKQLQVVGGVNVHNDYLQFLAEHGAVGFALIVASVVLLLFPVFEMWKRLIAVLKFVKPANLPAKPVQLFVLPAPVFCILMAILATLIHCFGDCPLRSGAVLVLFYASLSALEGFLPSEASADTISTIVRPTHHHASR